MRIMLCIALTLIIAGCAGGDRSTAGTTREPDPQAETGAIEVRFHLATLEQQPDHLKYVDNLGRVIWAEANPTLTERDIERADALHGEHGSFVSVTFTRMARSRFAQLTRENRGALLAILVDGTLLIAPTILEEIRDGKVSLSGDFTHERAEAIAAALTR